MDSIGDREHYRPVAVGPEGLAGHVPATEGTCLNSVRPQGCCDLISMFDGMGKSRKRNAADYGSIVGLAMQPT
jgi:hypothetical protein